MRFFYICVQILSAFCVLVCRVCAKESWLLHKLTSRAKREMFFWLLHTFLTTAHFLRALLHISCAVVKQNVCSSEIFCAVVKTSIKNLVKFLSTIFSQSLSTISDVWRMQRECFASDTKCACKSIKKNIMIYCVKGSWQIEKN